jgi:hypothetical protein
MNAEKATLDDTALATLPPRVKVAAAVIFMAGAFGMIHVAQLFGLVARIQGPWAAVPHAMGFAAACTGLAGVSLYRARPWAAWLGASAGGVLWATSTAWFLFAAANEFFTLFGVVVPFFALAALVFALRARKACEITAAARRRLAEQGFELGV